MPSANIGKGAGFENCHSNVEQVSPAGRPLTAAILYSLSVTFLSDRAKVYAAPKINKVTSE